MPLKVVSEAFFMTALISSYLAGLARRTVRSTTDTSGVGTRKAMPVSLPFNSGITLPTALAAPVEDGMMFWAAPRPPRQSLAEGPSTVFWVAVVACTVVIRPSRMPKLSLMTLAKGARQLVVQDALETMFCAELYFSWFTPMTNMGASAEGAEITTFLAPAMRWPWAFSTVVNRPVDSMTKSAPTSRHFRSAGFFSAVTRMALPFTTSLPSLASAVPLKAPWVESYLSM